MKILIERLEICLKYISDTNATLNKDLTKDELLKIIDDVMTFTYLHESDLFILRQLIIDFFVKNHEDIIAKNICLLDSKKTVKRFGLDQHIFDSWNKRMDRLKEDQQLYDIFYTEECTDNIFRYNEWKEMEIEHYDNPELLNIAGKILKEACEIIDFHLFNNRKFEDERIIGNKHSNEYVLEISKEDYFYKEFIEGKATLSDWKKYPNTGFRTYYERNYNTTSEGWTRIDNHQNKLFFQAVNDTLDILKAEIINIPKDFQLNNARTQLIVLNKFIYDSYSSLDFKRINKILEFNDPEEVILELDDMKRYDVYNYDTFLPYNGPNNKKSPRFVATILIEFQLFLENFIKELVDSTPTSVINGMPPDILVSLTNKNDFHTLPKPKSFRLKFKPNKESILRTVLHQLRPYDIIDLEKNSTDDLINILLCSNFMEIEKPVFFGTNTNFCCLVLKEFFPYFENMNASSLDQSKLFKTKNGKFLTQTNFNKSVNEGTKKEMELTEIKKIIRQLEEKNSKSSNN